MIFEFRCLSCNHITELKRSIANRNAPAHCESCGGETKRIITGGQGFAPVYGAADFPGYRCPVSDQWVDSRKKRKEIMAENDLREHSSADQVRHHNGFG